MMFRKQLGFLPGLEVGQSQLDFQLRDGASLFSTQFGQEAGEEKMHGACSPGSVPGKANLVGNELKSAEKIPA